METQVYSDMIWVFLADGSASPLGPGWRSERSVREELAAIVSTHDWAVRGGINGVTKATRTYLGRLCEALGAIERRRCW